VPNLNLKIFVAGHRGMVGAAIVRQLQAKGHRHIVVRTSAELDLTNQAAVVNFFENQQIDIVYLAAAKVGGIHANSTYPAEFIYQNLMIEANVVHQAFLHGVRKLLFLGSSCIYPKFAEQPMGESALLDGYLESTNEPYAIAKIAGIKLCESYNRQYGVDYRSVMPTNLYGPGDNYHLENSHVVPALIRRLHEAKVNNVTTVKAWGTGTPMREFLYVDDMAAASTFIMDLDSAVYNQEVQPMLSHINVGSGIDCTIKELTEIVAKVVGYEGQIEWDANKPDGAPRKLMDVSRLKRLGWQSSIDLDQGLKMSYECFLNNYIDSYN
jgi:GDP-L-fucose synthase